MDSRKIRKAINTSNINELEKLINITSINDIFEGEYTLLHYAAKQGKLECVKSLIGKGANVNITNVSNEKPIHIAAKEGHKEVVAFFVNEKDVNINEFSNNRFTPLHYAAESNKFEVVKFLVENGADISKENSEGKTALQLAQEEGYEKIVKLLRNKALLVAVEEGKLDEVKKCTEDGADVDVRDKDGNTALHIAAQKGYKDIIEFLVDEKSLNVNDLDKNNWIPLHYAAKNGKLEVIKFLISKEANINAQNSQGEVPVDLASDNEIIRLLLNEALFYAVKQNQVSEIKKCFNKEVSGIKADINATDLNDWTPLHYAAGQGKLEIVELLVKEGADINAESLDGKKPLDLATNQEVRKFLLNKALFDVVEKGELTQIEKYLNYGADVDAQNSNGSKPIHIAAKKGRINIVQLLINVNAKVNDKGENDYTPLHYAAEGSHFAIVQYLVKEQGADINAQSSQNKVPVDLASNREIISFLLNQALFRAVKQNHQVSEIKRCFNKEVSGIKADINATDLNDWTPLHYAAKQGNVEVISLLTTQGADINARNSDGEQPLHIAIKNGHKDNIKFLTNNNINDYGKNDYTPLHYAAEQGNLKIVELLFKEGADVNAQNSQGKVSVDLASDHGVISFLLNEALFHAVKQSQVSEIKKYSNKKVNGVKANINATDINNWTPLHYAAKQGNVEVISLLITQGADINARNSDGEQPLHIAIKNGHKDNIKLFINKNISDHGKNGYTPLHYAAEQGTLEIVELLVKEGADISAKNLNGNKPLEITEDEEVKNFLLDQALLDAVKQGKFIQAEKYLNDGADVNAKNSDGDTPLHVASQSGYIQIIQLLIEKGADINARNLNDKKPLELVRGQKSRTFLLNKALFDAVEKGELDEVEKYLNDGADVDAKNSEGNKPIHIAAKKGHKKIVRFLINVNAKVNDKGKNDYTPLHYATEGNHFAIVQYLVEQGADINLNLVEQGADINLKNADNNKPIHLAARNGNTDIVNFFLSKRMNVDDLGKNNWTPLHYAAEQDKLEVVDSLIKAGADVNASNSECQKPLDLTKDKKVRNLLLNKTLFDAIKQGSIEEVKKQLDSGASVSFINRWGWQPLHVASARNNLPLVEYLVKNQRANINAKTANGNKPIHIAAAEGYKDIIKFFINEKMSSINDFGNNHWTPLHYAVRNNNLEVAEFLVDNGADVDVSDYNDNIPLDFATEGEFKELLRNKALLYDVKRGNDSKVLIHLNNGANPNYSDKNGWTVLHEAASRGHLPVVEILINKGANINVHDKNYNKPVHVAAKNGHKDIVKFFLDKEIDINGAGKSNKTLLHYAIEEEDLELTKLLMKEGANINAVDFDGKTLLQLAEEKDNKEIVDLLLSQLLFESVKNNDVKKVKEYIQKGANINYIGDHNGWAPLHYTAYSEQLTLAKILLEEGANMNIPADNQDKPLHVAVMYGNKDMVDLLIKKGVDINAAGEFSRTPLHYAALSEFNRAADQEDKYLHIVKFLVEKGADINAEDSNDKTPLNLAIENRQNKVIKYLSNASLFYATSRKDLKAVEHYIQNGADVNARNKEGFTPLHKAALSGDQEIVEFLLNKNANIHAESHKNYSILHEAAKSGNLEIVKLLIKHGANIVDLARNGESSLHIAAEYGYENIVEFFNEISVNVKDDKNWTPLHYAAKNCKLEFIKFLINKGADLNAEDADGLKPLHVAAKYGNKDVVEFFVEEKGLNANDQDKNNRTVIYYAAESGKLEIIEFLFNKGAKINIIDNNSVSPLHVAAECGHKDVVQFFLNQRLSIDHSDKYNMTSLHYAARGGDVKVVSLLCQNGANINSRDYKNAKPLHIAAQHGHKDIVEFFIIQKDLSINDRGKDHWTPLYYAASGRDGITHQHISENKLLEVMKFLLRQDETIINARDVYDAGVLHIAAKYGHEGIVDFLILIKGLDINSTDRHGFTPLHYAAQHGHLKIVKLLTEGKGDIQAVSDYGTKPIHSAAKNAHKNVVLFFVQKGVSINDQEHGKNWTLLHYAADSGKLDFVESLLAKNANVNAIDANNAKPLHIAAGRGYQRVIELLINQGMDVNDLGQDNWTPLHYAARYDHLETVRFLIEERRANINAVDLNGKMPLHVAAENGHKDIVKFFLDKGISVDAVDAKNWTPLHHPARKGFLKIVKFLVEEKGANVNLLTVDSENALDLAISKGNEEVAEYLNHHKLLGRRNKRFATFDQPQSSQASKQSSFINTGLAWMKGLANDLSSYLIQPVKTSVSLNNCTHLSIEDIPTHKTSDQQTILQEKFHNINIGDIMLFCILYSWLNGNKFNTINYSHSSSSLLERDIIGDTLNIGERFESVVNDAAHSSNVELNIDFCEVNRRIAVQIRNNNYDSIPSLLNSYVNKACLQENLSQKQIDHFKSAYSIKQSEILGVCLNNMTQPISAYLQDASIEEGIKKQVKYL